MRSVMMWSLDDKQRFLKIVKKIQRKNEESKNISDKLVEKKNIPNVQTKKILMNEKNRNNHDFDKTYTFSKL